MWILAVVGNGKHLIYRNSRSYDSGDEYVVAPVTLPNTRLALGKADRGGAPRSLRCYSAREAKRNSILGGAS